VIQLHTVQYSTVLYVLHSTMYSTLTSQTHCPPALSQLLDPWHPWPDWAQAGQSAGLSSCPRGPLVSPQVPGDNTPPGQPQRSQGTTGSTHLLSLGPQLRGSLVQVPWIHVLIMGQGTRTGDPLPISCMNNRANIRNGWRGQYNYWMVGLISRVDGGANILYEW
jgi:hypothetical protein